MNDGIAIALEDQGEYGLDGIGDAGMRTTIEERAHLSEIIEVINDRFGMNLTEGDKLYFDQMEQKLVENETLAKQAKSNTKDNFKFGFDDVFVNTLISQMDDNKELFGKMMDDDDFSKVVKTFMLDRVYERLRKAG